jgi:hypothetical protein
MCVADNALHQDTKQENEGISRASPDRLKLGCRDVQLIEAAGGGKRSGRSAADLASRHSWAAAGNSATQRENGIN